MQHPCTADRPCRPRGYTLIELIVTLLVIAIVLALGLPALHRLVDRLQGDSAVHVLSVHLAMARTMAVQQRRAIVICPTLDDMTCSDDGAWHQGWMTYPEDGQWRADDSRLLLREPEPSIAGHGRIHSNRRTPLRFDAHGMTLGLNRSLWICVHDQLHATLIVRNTGRIRSERPTRWTRCPVRGQAHGSSDDLRR